MKKPDWFILMEQWIPRGMGQSGVTLPFLVGALAFKAGQTKSETSDARKLLNDIVTESVDGFATQVNWCGNIDAPVMSVVSISSPIRMDTSIAIPHPSGQGKSLVFAHCLSQTMYWDSSDPYVLLERLVQDAAEHIENSNYSRNRNNNWNFEYGPFLPKEILYIEKTIMSLQS